MVQDKTGSIMGPYTHEDFQSMLESLKGKEGIRVCLPYTFWITLDEEEAFEAFQEASEQYHKLSKKKKIQSWDHFPEVREECSSPNQSSGEITQMIIPAQLQQESKKERPEEDQEDELKDEAIKSNLYEEKIVDEEKQVPSDSPLADKPQMDSAEADPSQSWIRIKSPEARDQKTPRKAELLVTFMIMVIGLALAGFIFFQTS
jgi:hypothetical protein